MATNDKRQADVPSGQPLSYQLGNEFDASWDHGETFRFDLGKGQVIPVWDQAIPGMKAPGCGRDRDCDRAAEPATVRG
jgi:FKBP-type peptidyl-prolyl isomerase-like protein